MSHTRRTFARTVPRHALVATAAVAALMFGTAGCTDNSGYSQQRISGYPYCVDRRTNRIVGDSHCNHNNHSSAFYYWMSPSRRSTGYVVPSSQRNYIDPANPAARQKVGLSKTGSVNSGRLVKGGLGKAGSGGRVGSGGKGAGG